MTPVDDLRARTLDEEAQYDAVTDPAVRAILDRLAPRMRFTSGQIGPRIPIVEWATATETIALATTIVADVRRCDGSMAE